MMGLLGATIVFSASSKYKTKIEFSVASFGTFNDDEFMKYVSNKFNVKIKPQALDWNNWEQQVNTWMAAGDMPDMLQWDARPWKMKQFKSWVSAGLLKPLPSLDKYPNLKALRSKMKIMDYYKINGKDYLWTKFRGDNKWSLAGPMAIMYRKDWAEKLGMAKEEYTIDELLKLAKAFVQKDPAGNGKGKTVGYAEVGWGWPWLLNYFNPYAATFVKVKGKWVWGPTMPETLEGIKFLRQMYKEGALWKDFYTAKDYDGVNLYMANRLGMWADNLGADWNKYRTNFKTANPKADVYKATALMKIKGRDGKYFLQEWDNTWSAYLFSSKMSDEKFKRILDIMDWAASPEGTRMCQFGFVNKDYVIKNNKIVLLWKKDSKGQYEKPDYITTTADAVRNLACLNGDFIYTDPTFDQKTLKDLIWLYKLPVSQPNNVKLAKINYAFDFFSAPYKDKYANTLASDFRQAVMKMVVSTDNIEGALKKFIQQNQAKANAIIRELTKAGI